MTGRSDIAVLTNAQLTARISDMGAELQALAPVGGPDLLWHGDPAHWGGRSPVLFPIVGRAEDDRIDLTEADIAGMLGVRRATVSEVGTVLEGKDLIQRGRGWVRVLDRDGLEEASCGCYGLMREVMKDLELPQPQAGSEAMRSGSSDA